MADRIRVWLINPQDRPHWQLQWIDPATGRRVTRSTRTADPVLAETMRTDREYELSRGLAAPSGAAPRRAWTWAEARAEHASLRLALHAPESRRACTRAMDLLESAASPVMASDVDALAVSRFVARLRGLPLEPGTRALYASRLAAALRWMGEQGIHPAPPPVPRLKVPDKAIRTITEADYRRLLAACPSPCWRRYLCLLWHTGLRQSEGAAVCWGEDAARIDLAAGRVWLPSVKDSGDTWLPLHPALRRELLRVPKAARSGPLCPGVPAGGDRRGEAFGGIAGAAGVDCTLHAMRRTFATRYAPEVPAQTLMRLMRHRSIKTTLKYYADLGGALDEAIRRA